MTAKGSDGDVDGDHLSDGPVDDDALAWAEDERVKAGVEHLQRAAQEAIAAGRAMLDVAEDLVGDPRSLTDLLGLLGKVGAGAASGRRVVDHRDGPDDDPPVQRIPVS